jgi:Uma2 family endonuclease
MRVRGMGEQRHSDIIAENVPYEEFLSERYGRHVEWIDGVVLAMPQPNIHELKLRWFLRCVFDLYLDFTGGGKTFSDPFTMKTGANLSARQPDLFVILPERSSLLTERDFAGAANLVVEIITSGYEARDKVEKFREYEQGGVQEYWILDPKRKELLFHVRGEDGLFHSHASVGGIYTSTVLPKLKLRVDMLWQEELPTTPEIIKIVEQMLEGDKT